MGKIIATFVLSFTATIYTPVVNSVEDRYPVIQYDFTEADMELIYRVVMSEAGGDGVLSQKGVTTVILNRLFSPRFPDTVPEVINGQFSTGDNGAPTEEVLRSVNMAIMEYGTRRQLLPYQCYYFRAWDYHSFGIPYCQFGNTYFSLAEEATD